MADVRSDVDSSTVSYPWFERIGVSGFAASGATLGFAISLLFVLKASPVVSAPHVQPIVTATRPATTLPSVSKPALLVVQPPARSALQSPEPLFTAFQGDAANRLSPDQTAAVRQPTSDQKTVMQSPDQAVTPAREPFFNPVQRDQAERLSLAQTGVTRQPAPDQKAVPSSEMPVGTTATGIPLHVGPRGGVFHYSTSGKKVYERKRR